MLRYSPKHGRRQVTSPSQHWLTSLLVFSHRFVHHFSGARGDSRIQSFALEASWKAKYAGLSEHDALGLIPRMWRSSWTWRRAVTLWSGRETRCRLGHRCWRFRSRVGGWWWECAGRMRQMTSSVIDSSVYTRGHGGVMAINPNR